MSHTLSSATLTHWQIIVRRFICAALLVVACAALISAQQSGVADSATDSRTPSALSPGAPAGSFPLSGFDNVSLYNGHLNFALPLLSVGGRGEAGYTISLKVERNWRAVSRRYYQGPGSMSWSAPIYYPEPNTWNSIEPGWGPGVLVGRASRDKDPDPTTFGYTNECYTITRLSFIAPDGTEFELRDQQTDGRPHKGLNGAVYSRGTVFITKDGSAATFISDQPISDVACNDTSTDIMLGFRQLRPSGYLILKNGVRYRIVDGNVTWMRDRNGNRVDFNLTTNNTYGTITDGLGRQVTLNGDAITYKGVGGVDRTITVVKSLLSQALRSDIPSTKTYKQLFVELNGASEQMVFDPQVVSSVVLPNGKSYTLRYNEYGELARVELPTGGAIEYDHTAGYPGTTAPPSGVLSGNGTYQIYRRVVERRVYKDGGTGASYESRTVYDKAAVQEATYGNSGNLLALSNHTFQGDAITSLFPSVMVWYETFNTGRETQTDILSTDGSQTLLRRSVNLYENYQHQGMPWDAYLLDVDRPQDPYQKQTTTTLADTNQVTKQVFVNDKYANQTDVYEYDFGSGAAPQYALRHTHTDFLTLNNGVDYAADTGIHLRGLPQAVQTYSVNPSTGAETLVAKSETNYDEGGFPLLPCDATVPCTSVPQWGDPGTTARGNATTSRRWLDASNTWLETHAQFDQLGNVRKMWDARDTTLSNPTQIYYADSFSDGVSRNTFAFPTSSTSPVPDVTGQYGSTTTLTSSTVYDFHTGYTCSTTDANNKTTTLSYTDGLGNQDPLDRLRSVTRPDGSKTDFNYFDTPGDLYVQTYSDMDATRRTESRQYFDGLGKAVRAFSKENQDTSKPWLTADTQYDALGRAWRTSNQYRSSGPGSAVNPSDRWTEATFDALGRATQVKTTADNAKVLTAYEGNKVLVTDQAGKKRMSRTDALGRLTDVWEVSPADAATVTVGFLGASYAAYPTSYIYDALGNLRTTTQATTQTTQTRTFVYDSLSRMTSASNPESGTVGYTYDNNGNLLTKTDARAVTTTYTYDKLNRNTTITYTGGGTQTPTVSRYYDNAATGANGLGRLHKTEAAATAQTTFTAYDEMGRPTQYQQKFWWNNAWGQAYPVQHGYNKGGGVTSVTYPSQRTVNYNYDAAGRIGDKDAQNLAMTGNLGDATTRTYASEVRYQEMGGREQERFGTDTPVYNKHFFNARGQMNEIRVSTYSILASGQETNWNRGAILNVYSANPSGGWTASGADNNGNLRRQMLFIPNDDAITGFWDTAFTYDYDALNRLDVAREQRAGNDYWVQDFDYDRFGNRTINAAGTWLENPAALPSDFVNEKEFEKETPSSTTNRLYAPGDLALSEAQRRMRYDAAGNLTQDTYMGGGTRTYDAENRMTAAQFVGGQLQTATFTYDGDGRRIKRNMGASGEMWQVYGMGGELLAEYAPNASPTSPQKEYGYRDGELLVTAEAPASISLAAGNSGFESPAVGGGSFQYGPTGGTWTFAGGSGVSGNSSAFTSGNPSAPEGAQVAFVQGGNTAVISQSVSGFQSGTNYTVSFKAARRGNGGGVPDFDVYLDTTLLGTFQPSSTSYASLSTASFTTTAGSHTLKFVGRNTAGGDNTAFVDDVRVAIAPATQSFVTGKTLGALRADYTGHVGMRITVGAQALTITSLGRIYVSGNTGTHTLKVVRASDNAVVASTDLSMTGGVSGQFKYAALASAVTLAANTDYYVVSMETSGGDTWYDYFGTVLTTTSAASVKWGMYGDGVNWGPAGGAGNCYVPVDFQYQTGGGSAANLQWLVSDQLGTPRMVLDKTGSLSGMTRHDYFPFGEEVPGDSVGRTIARGYVGDTLRQRWAKLERDFETGLEFAQARYYSSAQGRFMSPDEFTGGPDELFDFVDAAAANPTFYADIENPQSLNKYQYAYNSPLRYNDPTGHCVGVLTPHCPQIVEAAKTVADKISQAAPYVAGAAATVAAAIAGSEGNTVGDPSCPACGGGLRAVERYRDMRQREADRQNIRNQDNSGNGNDGEEATPQSNPEPKPVSKKEAVSEAHRQVGKQTERRTGKFGSPTRGNSKKGYRLDPPNPRGTGLEKTHRHVNWWDYSKGKKNKGGRKGYIPIKPKKEGK